MRAVASLVAVSLLCTIGVNCAMASSVRLKVGYFNLAQVKADYPQAKGTESTRAELENQLRKDVDEGNASLQRAKAKGASKDELERMAKELQLDVNAKQQAFIKQVQELTASSSQTIAKSVGEVCGERGLDLAVDGSSVYAGGQLLVIDGIDITDDVIHKLVPSHQPGARTKTAQPLTLNPGFFNLAVVKSACPEAAGTEALRAQSENQLRRDVEEGNNKLKQAQAQRKSKSEIEQMAAQIQSEINAKQKALVSLVQSQQTSVTQTIAGKVATVAKEEGINLVVDGAGVFFGGDKLVDSGVDLTAGIMKRVSPGAPPVATNSATPVVPSYAPSTTQAAPPAADPPAAAPPVAALPVVAAATPSSNASSSTAAVGAASTTAAASADNKPIRDKWALVIGISKFEHPEYNLKYAAKDAQDFYNFLVNEANFKKDHVLLLLDENATRENIMDAFGDEFLPAVCEPGDLVVVYVSTHGTPKNRDKGGRNYIVAYNTNAQTPYSTGVDMEELYRRIKEGVKTDRALIVMDTCYSGGGVPGSRALGLADNFDAAEIAQGCGHLVISSSSPNERSWESRVAPNGVFTKYLLDALRKNNKRIDVKSAFSDVQKNVSWEVKSVFSEKQTPQLGGEWEGRELILSLPATENRPVLNPDLLKLMHAANNARQPAGTPAKSTPSPANPAKPRTAPLKAH